MSAPGKFVNRHPWLLVLYLLVVTFTAFLTPGDYKPWVVGSLLAVQLVILAVYGKLDESLWRILDRLKFLFAFLILANALLPGAVADHYWELPGGWFKINLTGLLTGVLMSSQILLVVLTTHVVRTVGEEAAFINGLRSLRVAPLLAYSLDTTLAMLDGSLRRSGGGGGGGMGRGDGSGGGGGHHRQRRGWLSGWRRASSPPNPAEAAAAEAAEVAAVPPDGDTGVLALFRALRQRDLTPFIDRINQGLRDAAQHAERLGLGAQRAHDVGVIGGIAAVMMAFKMVKILPGMPVMQGAKTIFFIPLYILAADRTHSRWGGTIAGGIMGFIAFLNGDSRYGIFEVLKHLVPGLVIDLIWPIAKRFPLRLWILVVVGLIAAAARTSTQFAMILCLGSDNATLLVFPALKLIPNGIAGFLSAFVSYPILKHLGSRAVAEREAAGAAQAAPAAPLSDDVDTAPSGLELGAKVD